MSNNPDRLELECPHCGESIILSLGKVSDDNTHACQNCGEEIELSVSKSGEIFGNNLDQLMMECPLCGEGFILTLSIKANDNIYVCEECGAEIEFTEEILQELGDALHGIEKRKCN